MPHAAAHIRASTAAGRSLRSPLGPGAGVLAQIGDALAWPLLVLQGDGRLLHANRAARRLLRRGQTLVLQPDRQLLLVHTPLQQAYERALAAASVLRRPGLLHWPGPEGRTEGGHAVTLTPLASPETPETPETRDAPDRPDPQAAVPVLLALAATDGCGTEIEAYAREQALSEGETRVLRCLAGGCSSVQIGTRLGITPSTVRSQLLNLRRKTGHDNVTELLLALARMPPVAAMPAEVVSLFEGD